MKSAELENNPYIAPREWIGQGWGYKSEWNPENLDEVIYIPEYAYEIDDEEKQYVNGWYTTKDFIELCDDPECPCDGEALFDMVDWQFPETLLDEIWDGRVEV